MLAVVFADLVDRHDVGVIEIRRRLGFLAEALHVRLRGQLAFEDHLEGNDALE